MSICDLFLQNAVMLQADSKVGPSDVGLELVWVLAVGHVERHVNDKDI